LRNGQIVIRTHFLNYTGKTVLHCHILNHEDLGMMAVLEIIQ
jgi:FtsP/CotA-like multicopper oxidase with cupredoxin domain